MRSVLRSSLGFATAATLAALPRRTTVFAVPILARRYAATSDMSVEATIRSKLTDALAPQHIGIRNDSALHAHHAAMVAARAAGQHAAAGPLETHFYVEVVSDVFEGLPTIRRHRKVNALLQDEFDRGLHALSLRLKTPAEVAKEAGAQQ